MKNIKKFFNDANFITTGIIIVILFIIICSQSFAVVGTNSISVFTSVINHNTVYLLVLIYFVFLKTYVGKKYFNYLNVFLMFIYLMATITSLLTVIQSFSLNTIFSFMINLLLIIYLFHTMFRDTRVWKEFRLGNSPFNELSNDFYFNSVVVIVILSLCVNLILTVVVSGLFISFLDALYVVLFTRYIYLYRSFLDSKKIDTNNEGNFDRIKEVVSENISDIKDVIDDKSKQIQETATEIIKDVDSKIDATVDEIKDKVNGDDLKKRKTTKRTKKTDKKESK